MVGRGAQAGRGSFFTFCRILRSSPTRGAPFFFSTTVCAFTRRCARRSSRRSAGLPGPRPGTADRSPGGRAGAGAASRGWGNTRRCGPQPTRAGWRWGGELLSGRPGGVGHGLGSTASGGGPRAGGSLELRLSAPGWGPGPPSAPSFPLRPPPARPRAPAASPRGGRGRGPSGGRGRGRPPRRYRGIPPGMKTLGGPQSRLPPALLPEPRRGFFGPGKKRTEPGPGERSFERRSAWLISRSPSVGGRRGDAVRIEPAREEEGV